MACQAEVGCDNIKGMNMKYQNRIITDPKIMTGKPIIKGTRIAVEFVLKLLAQGENVKDILQEYPHLKKEDIYAAIEYATDAIAEEKIYPLPFLQHDKKAKAFA